MVDEVEADRHQPLLEVESEGVWFRTARMPGHLDVFEPAASKPKQAVAWPGSPIVELEPVKGGVLVRTAAHKGAIQKSDRGKWMLTSARKIA